MKSLVSFLLLVVFATPSFTQDTSSPRWTDEKANEWYDAQAWPCGFNYIPANAISYTEMWMPYSFDQKLIDKELALAEEIGFNVLRVVLPFVVWEHNPAEFKDRLYFFLDVCDNRGLKVMFTFFDDCAFGNDEKLKNPWYGQQPDVLEGWYANGWTPSPGHDMVRDPETWPRLESYVKDVITAFQDDDRVWVWDLYNEPTNGGGLREASVPLVEKVFEWAKAVNPDQPLTVALFSDYIELMTSPQRLEITHGPYLVDSSDDAMTVVWFTNENCYSWLEYSEYKPSGTFPTWGGYPKIAKSSSIGLIDANTKKHVIRIKNLDPGIKYKYRVNSKKILQYQPYEVIYGETAVGDFHEFSTLNPRLW